MSPSGAPGRPWFYQIPPLWLPMAEAEQIAQILDSKVRVPVHVDAWASSAVRSFADFLQEVKRTGSAPAVSFSLENAVVGAATGFQKTAEEEPIVLSDEAEEGFREARFRSRLPVQITGLRTYRSGNVVDIAGSEVIVTDAPFRLFLRLVLGL